MSRVRAFLLFVVEVVCYSVIAGFAAMFMSWVFSKGIVNSSRLFKAFKIGWAAAAVLLVIKAAVLYFIEYRRVSRLDRQLSKSGYSDEYYELIRKETERSPKKRREEMKLYMAGELNDGGRLQQALEVLRGIDISDASDMFLVEYYNTYLYILLVNGDLETAEIVYGAGMSYLERYSSAKATDGAVMHTLGVLEYARGNYSKAESLFIRAKSMSEMQNIINACNMYLALVYLKTDRRDYAKKITAETMGCVTNLRQKQELKGLMRMVEKAYGL